MSNDEIVRTASIVISLISQLLSEFQPLLDLVTVRLKRWGLCLFLCVVSYPNAKSVYENTSDCRCKRSVSTPGDVIDDFGDVHDESTGKSYRRTFEDAEEICFR